jgi:hypothetical protein
LNDGGRTNPLYDPMIKSAVWPSVQQDVSNIVANRQSRVGWLRSLLSDDQMEHPFKNPDMVQWKWGNESCSH